MKYCKVFLIWDAGVGGSVTWSGRLLRQHVSCAVRAPPSFLSDSNTSWRCNLTIMAALDTGLFTLKTLHTFTHSKILPVCTYHYMNKIYCGTEQWTKESLHVCLCPYTYQSHGKALNYCCGYAVSLSLLIKHYACSVYLIWFVREIWRTLLLILCLPLLKIHSWRNKAKCHLCFNIQTPDDSSKSGTIMVYFD